MAPKRPADSYSAPPGGNQGTNAGGSKGKRVKFAGAAQDATTSSSNNATTGDVNDALEADLEAGAGGGSKRVMTAGYDSDSSVEDDDGFGGVGGGRQGSKKQKKSDGAPGPGKDGGAAEDDDDDDMFGDAAAKLDGKDGDARKQNDKGKQKEFLEMGDIEGQEFGKGDDEEGAADDDDENEELEEDYAPEDDHANDDDAPRSRRSKKGMGFQLSSFNMADELSEGRFTTDGTYVRNAEDQLAKHDAWLNGLSKKQIKAARDSKQRMDEEAKRREEIANRGEEALAQERDDCMIGLLSLIREGETVSKALTRLGGNRKKGVKRKIKAKGDDMEVDDEGDNSHAAVQATSQASKDGEEEDPVLKKINRITFFASTLLAQGELEIYSKAYEDLIKTLREEGAVRRDWVPPRDPDIEKDEAEADAKAKQQAASGGRRTLIARPSSSTAGGVASTPSESSTKLLYKWVTPTAGAPADQEHGPFTKTDLHNWIVAGYFGPGAERILIKAEGGDRWMGWNEAQSL
ncbi:hypothetical protein OIO90_000119 [Microbotryomycetes sp. JL221]|nr:hypothetical protein OIO90_000119 [Microbotryomycetes sp. JL221]